LKTVKSVAQLPIYCEQRIVKNEVL